MVLMKVNSAVVLSSIPLQMVYYFNIFYYIFYFLVTFFMIIYKSQVFSFPDGNLALDLVLLILMGILEVTRLYHGFKGNLTEEAVPVVTNLVLTIGRSTCDVTGRTQHSFVASKRIRKPLRLLLCLFSFNIRRCHSLSCRNPQNFSAERQCHPFSVVLIGNEVERNMNLHPKSYAL
ncbi:transmembrane protein 80-like isoform X1 [Rhinoraja longicauda]